MTETAGATPQDDIAARMASLSELVAYHNRRYHELDDPEISDGDYDALVRELRALEAEHPDLVVDGLGEPGRRRGAERAVRAGRPLACR